MNDTVQNILEEFAEKNEFNLERTPQDAPLVTGEEWLITKTGELFLKLSRKQSASVSIINKSLNLNLILKVKESGSFEISKNSFVNRLVQLFSKYTNFNYVDNGDGHLFNLCKEELKKPFWKDFNHVIILLQENELKIELKSIYDEPMESAIEFIIRFVNSQLNKHPIQ